MTSPARDGGVDPVVDCRGVTKRYATGATAVDALADVTLAIERGSITGILGENGAGKSTLLKTILGLVTPTAGTVRVGGVDVFADAATARSTVAAVLEGTRNVYWRLTPRENVAFFARLHGVPGRRRADRIDRVLAAVGLAERDDVQVGELSRGMKQRCALACALVRDAPLLLLDEPTLGLDRHARGDLLDELVALADREERTIVVSSHDTAAIERICNRVVVLEGGRIVADGSIGALGTAFDARACSIALDGEVPAGRVATVVDGFDVRRWRVDRGVTRFEVVVTDPDDLYALVAALRDADLSLRSVRPDDLGGVYAALGAGGAHNAVGEAS